MPLTYDEYIEQNGLGFIENKNPVATGGQDTYRDVYNTDHSNTVKLPQTSSDRVANRENFATFNPGGVYFGNDNTFNDQDEDGYLDKLGEGLADLGSGAHSQVHGVLTRFPAIVAQEFSDLIGDKAEAYPEFAQDLISGMDDFADEMAESLMDDYRQGVADNGWAFTEENQPSFMFKLGSGAASLVEAIGITLVFKNPSVAAAFFGGALQQTDTYAKSLSGLERHHKEAFAIANAAGAIRGSYLSALGLKPL